jgi:hypothetical protein
MRSKQVEATTVRWIDFFSMKREKKINVPGSKGKAIRTTNTERYYVTGE